jgi:hypothetical protein
VLSSIRGQSFRPQQVIIVDGGDSTVEGIAEQFPDLPIDYLRVYPPALTKQKNAGVASVGPGITLIGFVDDDAAKWGLRVHEYPVFGGRDAIKGVLERYQVDEIVIAIGSKRGELVSDIVGRLREIENRPELKIAPSLSEMLQPNTSGCAHCDRSDAHRLKWIVVGFRIEGIMRPLPSPCSTSSKSSPGVFIFVVAVFIVVPLVRPVFPGFFGVVGHV